MLTWFVAHSDSLCNFLVDMSTIMPSVARKETHAVRAKGSESLDGPVSGGEVGAKNASLTIIFGGGSQAAFDRAKPIFEKMGKTITLVGEAGAGQVTKAAHQIIVGVRIAAVSAASLIIRHWLRFWKKWPTSKSELVKNQTPSPSLGLVRERDAIQALTRDLDFG